MFAWEISDPYEKMRTSHAWRSWVPPELRGLIPGSTSESTVLLVEPLRESEEVLTRLPVRRTPTCATPCVATSTFETTGCGPGRRSAGGRCARGRVGGEKKRVSSATDESVKAPLLWLVPSECGLECVSFAEVDTAATSESRSLGWAGSTSESSEPPRRSLREGAVKCTRVGL